jgi:hypothetical protein
MTEPPTEEQFALVEDHVRFCKYTRVPEALRAVIAEAREAARLREVNARICKDWEREANDLRAEVARLKGER